MRVKGRRWRCAAGAMALFEKIRRPKLREELTSLLASHSTPLDADVVERVDVQIHLVRANSSLFAAVGLLRVHTREWTQCPAGRASRLEPRDSLIAVFPTCVHAVSRKRARGAPPHREIPQGCLFGRITLRGGGGHVCCHPTYPNYQTFWKIMKVYQILRKFV